jgi:DNA-binding MarR family transcriptional regulator
MDYTFLKELISLAEQYEQSGSGGNATVADFAGWLLRNGDSETYQDDRIGDQHLQYGVSVEKIETTIARMVIYLYRYARMYTRQALEGSPLQTADEFGYLATLLSYEHLRKTDLIAKNVHEKPTGMDIIRRLHQHGLIDQLDDPADKRGKLVRINDRGRGVLFSVFGKMGKVSDLIGGELSDPEKKHLVYLLQKLDKFHYHIFLHEKDERLNTLR